MTAGLLTALLGALALAGHLLAGWWRRRKDAATIARVTVERDVAKGRAEVAVAQAAVVGEVAAEKSAAVVVAAEYRAEVAAEIERATTPAAGVPIGASPMDAIRAADRVRAKIAAKRKAGK